jgi:hypothetical protein
VCSSLSNILCRLCTVQALPYGICLFLWIMKTTSAVVAHPPYQVQYQHKISEQDPVSSASFHFGSILLGLIGSIFIAKKATKDAVHCTCTLDVHLRLISTTKSTRSYGVRNVHFPFWSRSIRYLCGRYQE